MGCGASKSDASTTAAGRKRRSSFMESWLDTIDSGIEDGDPGVVFKGTKRLKPPMGVASLQLLISSSAVTCEVNYIPIGSKGRLESLPPRLHAMLLEKDATELFLEFEKHLRRQNSTHIGDWSKAIVKAVKQFQLQWQDKAIHVNLCGLNWDETSYGSGDGPDSYGDSIDYQCCCTRWLEFSDTNAFPGGWESAKNRGKYREVISK